MILKNRINPLQFSLLLSLSSLGFVTMIDDTVTCFTMIIAIVVSFLLLIPVLVISYKEDIKVPVIFKSVASVFAVLLSAYLVNKFSDFFSTMVNTATPEYFISGLLLLSLLYPATKGIEAVSRSAIIAGAFVVLSLVLVISLLPYGDMSYFYDNDKSFNITDAVETLLCFSSVTLSLFFYRNINKNKIRSVVFPFLIIAFIICIVMCFVKLLDISEYVYPFYTLSEVSCKVIPMGFSGLFISFSLVCVFYSVLYFTLSVKSITDCHTKFMSVVFIVVVYIISVITLYNENLNDILLNKYLLLGLYLIITLIIPIAVVVKEKKNDKKKS